MLLPSILTRQLMLTLSKFHVCLSHGNRAHSYCYIGFNECSSYLITIYVFRYTTTSSSMILVHMYQSINIKFPPVSVDSPFNWLFIFTRTTFQIHSRLKKNQVQFETIHKMNVVNTGQCNNKQL